MYKKIVSIILVAALGAGCLAACGVEESADSSADMEQEGVSGDILEEATAVTQAASELYGDNSTEAGKEETVYVVTDANGSPVDTIVSVWLKNPEKSYTITDVSNLSDIENVNGDETCSVDADGSLIWQADGNDIYYQGNSEEVLPIEMNISYELDGERVNPEELEGATGHLVIDFSYVNDTAQQRTVDGKIVTMYQPFVVASGMILDNDKAVNVTVDNGKVIGSSDETIVVGFALPGLYESLGLDEMTDEDGNPVDIDIPESVTVEADVADFSLLTTLTVVSNSVLGEINLDNVDTLEDLKGAIDELTDASAQLVDGSSALYDGTSELSDGAGTLADGASQLESGARSVADGASSLSSGLDDLKSGTAAFDAALRQLQAQVADLPAGVSSLESGALAIKTALKGTSGQSVYEGAGAIAAGAKGISDGAADIIDGLSGVSMSDISNTLTGATSYNAAAVNALSDYLNNNSGLDESAKAVISSAITNIETSSGLVNGVSEGMTGLSSSMTAVSPGLSDIKNGADAIEAGAESIQSGIDAMISGNNGQNLDALIDGLATLSDSGDALVEGVKQLAEASSQLADGADSAAVGAGQLKDGSAALADASTQVQDGTASLADGISELMNGASDLMDGMAEFDEDGIQQLADLFENNGENFLDRLRALQDYSYEYNTFSGCHPDMPCTVKFIIRTESIG